MSDARFEDTSEGSARGSPFPEREDRPVREPMFNAPWPAMLVVALIIGGYALQSRFPPEMVNPFVFAPADLSIGHWWTSVTAIFLHGSWTHALTNAAFALAFGAPTARFLGANPAGVAAFFGFYVLTGVIGNLGFAALHPGEVSGVVGASGAVAGLMAAGARLLGGHGQLNSIFSRMSVSMGLALLAVNLLIAVFGSALVPGADGAGIAWEAHLAGFAAGALLIGPFAWLARRG
jgi:membrane associated rhomboid family serine protease